MSPKLACNPGFKEASLPWPLKRWDDGCLLPCTESEDQCVSGKALAFSKGRKKTNACIPIFEVSSLASSNLSYPAFLVTDL